MSSTEVHTSNIRLRCRFFHTKKMIYRFNSIQLLHKICLKFYYVHISFQTS